MNTPSTPQKKDDTFPIGTVCNLNTEVDVQVVTRILPEDLYCPEAERLQLLPVGHIVTIVGKESMSLTGVNASSSSSNTGYRIEAQIPLTFYKRTGVTVTYATQVAKHSNLCPVWPIYDTSKGLKAGTIVVLKENAYYPGSTTRFVLKGTAIVITSLTPQTPKGLKWRSTDPIGGACYDAVTLEKGTQYFKVMNSAKALVHHRHLQRSA
ncbi:hypothetical protein H0H87_002781 [Tephrocybe sp. NHM501043]|nr:hypothetical protein H0H87_002781 [Tephrocybe sp. NHM501043]